MLYSRITLNQRYRAQIAFLENPDLIFWAEVWSVSCFTCLWVFVTPWTVAHQAPLSMGMDAHSSISVVVQSLSHVKSVWLHRLQHARLPCASPAPGACSNSCPSSQWCHPTISSSVVPFFSCFQSFPASWSFLMSLLFAPGGRSIRVSVSASVLPMNMQDWFPLGLTCLIFLLFKGLSRVFS